MRLEDMRGRRYGRYEILDLLGRGGMAAVYRARDTMLQRDVALKLLYPQYSGDTTLVERFEREAVLAAQLDHAAIVPIYDVGEAAGVVYIAMKLLHGRSLADVLAQQPVLEPGQLAPIVDQIASALDYAHARGIVHRDIKPANIILEERGAGSRSPANSDPSAPIAAVLTDFGIAKSLDSPSMTGTGVLIGTPDYMAPEQIRGDRAIDGRADVYALGALVFRALTGRRPFEGTTQEVLLGHLEGKLPVPSAINPQLARGVDAVLLRAMASHPADRYESAGAFARALRSAAGIDARTTRPAGRLPGNPSAGLPGVGAGERARRATANQPTGQPTGAADAPGAIAALHTTGRSAPPESVVALPAPEARLRRLAMPVLIVAGLLALLAAGLALGRISAGGTAVPTFPPDAGAPTEIAAPSATVSPTLAPTATSAPTDTAQPSASVQPSATAEPSATTAASPVPASPTPTTRPTQAPATAVPATSRPTDTAAPTATPTATSAPSPTATPAPSATSIPTSTSTPPATPCPIASTGGFALLRDQNELVRTRMGCPAQPIQGGAGTLAEQPFQHGSMLYFAPREAIWVFVGVDKGSWYRFDQATLEDRPTATPAPTPGPGLFVPVRGFGLVWAYNEEVRNQLGYGTAPEGGLYEGAYQAYTGGTMLYSATGLGRGKSLYMLYNDGTFERYDDPNQ